MTAVLAVVAGLPGTGRSTLSRALAAELGAMHLRATCASRPAQRSPDLAGQRVPTWAEVLALHSLPWSVERDGRRARIDPAAAALGAALLVLDGVRPAAR